MLKNIFLISIIIIFVALASGCTENNTEIKEIAISGHGSQVYTFANDIREALKVSVNEPIEIKRIFATNSNFVLVFDGSDSQDNAYFRVVLINMNKIPTYYAYEGRVLSFEYYYYIGDNWYNDTDGNITRPAFAKPVIWLKGPATGATETSLKLENNIIYLQGTSYKNLTLAGDKLTLLSFGIDNI